MSIQVNTGNAKSVNWEQILSCQHPRRPGTPGHRRQHLAPEPRGQAVGIGGQILRRADRPDQGRDRQGLRGDGGRRERDRTRFHGQDEQRHVQPVRAAGADDRRGPVAARRAARDPHGREPERPEGDPGPGRQPARRGQPRHVARHRLRRGLGGRFDWRDDRPGRHREPAGEDRQPVRGGFGEDARLHAPEHRHPGERGRAAEQHDAEARQQRGRPRQAGLQHEVERRRQQR